MSEAPSDSLTGLVYHVELCKAGWHERALEYILLAVLYETNSPQLPGSLEELINDRLPAPMGRAQVERLVRNMLASGTITETADGHLCLSHRSIERFRAEEDQHGQLLGRVKDHFSAVCSRLPDQAQITWAQLDSTFLGPLVVELGARTRELLSGGLSELAATQTHQRVLALVQPEYRPALALALQDFFDSKNADIRSYLLRRLNAALLIQAVALPPDALGALTKRTSKQLLLKVFLDTNFLFSLLGLHKNPADDVVAALEHLITTLRDRLKILLYVLPITVDEAKRTLGAYEDSLGDFTLSRHLARAAHEGAATVSGITLQFIAHAMQSPHGLSAHEYFQPYREDLLSVLRAKGVELYNESADDLTMDQSVIDDVLSQQDFERKARPHRKPKSYEKWLHDVVLWHFARRKRPTVLESPLEAVFWVATIDFGFLGFDRFKCRSRHDDVPVCIHPTVLLQLLQFWVPRSDLLDAALVESIQPLLPHVFDREAEQVTIRIVRALSRFADADDISRETSQRILLDRALRSRIAATTDVEEQISLVHEAVVIHLKEMEEKAARLEAERAGLTEQVAARDDLLEALNRRVMALEAEASAKADEDERRREADLERSRNYEAQLAAIERRREKLAVVGLAVGCIASLLGALVAARVLIPWIGHLVRWPSWLVALSSYTLMIALAIGLVDALAGRHQPLARHWLTRAIRWTRKTVWGCIVAVGLSILASIVWAAIIGSSG